MRVTICCITVMAAAVLVGPAGSSGAAQPGGSLFAFGDNEVGQLGSATNLEASRPNPTPELVNIPGQSGPTVTRVAGGYDSSFVVTSSGELYAFGENQFGQLGNSTNNGTSSPNPTPKAVALPGESGVVTQVAAGADHSLVVTSTGQLYSFGYNKYGQLGVSENNGQTAPNPTPTLVTLPEESGPVTQVAAGDAFSLAVTSSGQLYAFGENQFGQLGSTTNNGNSKPNATPTLVRLPGESGPVIAVAAGVQFGLAVTSSGQLYAFGENYYGQLGSSANKGTTHPNAPELVALPGESGPVTQVAAGRGHSLAVTSSGQLYAFGENYYGQLGNPTNNGESLPNPTPTLVTLPGESGLVTQVAAGWHDSLAVTSSGQLYTFGENEFGELGDATNEGTQKPGPTPTLVTLPEGRAVTQVAAGEEHSLVVAAGAAEAAGQPTAGAPSLSSTFLPGQTLTCDPDAAGWTGSPTFTYQWLLDGTAIAGATSAELTVAESDEGHTLACQVTGTNGGGSTTAVTTTVHVGSVSHTGPAQSGLAQSGPAQSGPALLTAPRVVASIEQNSVVGAPVTINASLSNANGGSPITGYTTDFQTPSGMFAAKCPSGSPYVSATFSAAANVSAVVTATSASGASSTTTIPFTVSTISGAARKSDLASTAGVISTVCSSSAPPAQSSGGAPSVQSLAQETFCRTLTFAYRIDSGLVDAESQRGCFVAGGPSIVPAEEWELLKYKRIGIDTVNDVAALEAGGASAARAHSTSLGEPATDTFYVFNSTVMVNGLEIEPAPGKSVVLAVGGTETDFRHHNAAYLVSANATIRLPLPLPGGGTVKVPVNWTAGTTAEAIKGGVTNLAEGSVKKAENGEVPGFELPHPGGKVELNVSSIEYVNDPETGEVVPRPHSKAKVTTFDLASALNEIAPSGLPFTLTGKAQPSFEIIEGIPQTNVADVQLGVPGILGSDELPITGSVQIHADNAHHGAYLECLGVGINPSEPAELAGIELKDLDVTYYGTAGMDKPGCVGTPPAGATTHAASSLVVNGDAVVIGGDLSGRFELDTGKVKPGASSWNGTLAYEGGSLDITPGSPVPVFLGSARFQFNDSSAKGVANLYAASPGVGGEGCGLLGYRGEVQVTWSPGLVIAGIGKTTVMCAPFGAEDGFLIEEASNTEGQPLVTVGIRHGENFEIPGVLNGGVSGTAALQLNLDTLNPVFEAELDGHASLQIPSISLPGGISTPSFGFGGDAQVVDSNIGLGACLKFGPNDDIEVGAGFHYINLVDGILTTTSAVLNPVAAPALIGARMLIGNEIDIGGCNVAPYHTLNVATLPGLDGKTSRAHAAAAAGPTITVTRGERQLVLDAVGSGSAPEPTLNPPGGGATISSNVPTGLYGEYFVIHEGNRTEIDVAHPAPGLWSVGAAAGSPPVASLRSSQVLGPRRASGSVHSAGPARETLRYRLTNVTPGTKLAFSEHAPNGASIAIGTATATERPNGTLRFSPGVFGAGRRAITLVATDPGGEPSAPLPVAAYHAPSFALGRPGRLRARRAGNSVIVSFTPAANAVGGDIVELILGDDSRRTLRAARGRRSVSFAGVANLGVASVTVRGVRGSSYGPIAGLIARSTGKHRRRRG